MQNVELRFLIIREYVDRYDDHEARWYQVPIDSEPVLQYRSPNQEWKNIPIVTERVLR